MFIEVSYPISHHMPVYPGLPDVELNDRERIANGDAWNGTVMTIYTHAGTHVDAPSHYRDGASTLDMIPIEHFMYEHPVMVEIDACESYLITIDDICNTPGATEADLLFFTPAGGKSARTTLKPTPMTSRHFQPRQQPSFAQKCRSAKQ